MSLLLDALKKAADKKNRNDQSDTDSETPDVELDLDLDLGPESSAETIAESSTADSVINDAGEHDSHPTIDDTFPEVDESALNTARPEPTDTDQASTTDNIEADTTEQSTTGEADELRQDTDHIIKDTTPETVHQPEDKTQPEPVSTVVQDEAIKAQQALEKEQALSALIDSSNRQIRKEKRKRLILIVLLVAVIVFVAGLYFYLQMATTTQDLYIANNNTANVNRTLSDIAPDHLTNEQAVTTPENTSAKAAARTGKPETSATINKPSPKKQSTSRPPNSITSKPEIFTIEHSQKLDPIDSLLRDAYSAFHRADLNQATSLYHQVLTQEPRNRDALLGQAAIAVKQQRNDTARDYYQKLLRLNPRDSHAIAGLTNLDIKQDASLSESQLKLLLRQQPEQAHLNFALGNIYAKQQRWPEAQSSYFNAWATDNSNADYAYNLAISLDQMDKHSQATEYYKLSLQLHQLKPGNFSVEDAQKRIRLLQGHKP